MQDPAATCEQSRLRGNSFSHAFSCWKILSLSLETSAIGDTNVGPGQKKRKRGIKEERWCVAYLFWHTWRREKFLNEKECVSFSSVCSSLEKLRGWPIREDRFIFRWQLVGQKGIAVRSVKKERGKKGEGWRGCWKKGGIIPRPFLKLIFSSVSVFGLWFVSSLFRSFSHPPFIVDKPYQPQLMRTGSLRTIRFVSRPRIVLPPLLKTLLRRKITPKAISLPNREP